MQLDIYQPIFAWTPGPWELILLLFVVLLLFGSKRLPSLARSMGRSLTEFKRGKDELSKEIKDGAAETEESKEG